jgi:hypothetical protein
MNITLCRAYQQSYNDIAYAQLPQNLSPGWLEAAAFRAGKRQRRATVGAKFATFAIVAIALRTAHIA